jgi:hypothetical protein
MVYKFVVLSDEDESFVREFEFLESQTLLDFHNIIQEELEYDKSQMASFYLATDNWEKEEEFTLFDMGTGSSTMDTAVLEEIIFRKNSTFSMTDLFLLSIPVKQKKLRTGNILSAQIQKAFRRNRLCLVQARVNYTTISSFQMMMMTMMRLMMLNLKLMTFSLTERMKKHYQILKTQRL